MDESNHEMVNLLTKQIGTVFNPLNQNVNQGYQEIATQMGRIADFFGSLRSKISLKSKILNLCKLWNL